MARKLEEVSFSKGTASQAEGTGCAMALRQAMVKEQLGDELGCTGVSDEEGDRG